MEKLSPAFEVKTADLSPQQPAAAPEASSLEFDLSRPLSLAKRLALIRREEASITPGKNGENCYGKSEYFFDEATDKIITKTNRDLVAKALCQTCPIIATCLERSLEQAEAFGTWGGVTEPERKKLLHRQPRRDFGQKAG